MSKLMRREWLYGYGMILPALLFIAVFLFWPVLYSIFLSFQKTEWFTSTAFVGVENYVKLLGSKEFLGILRNTAVITVTSVPVIVLLSTLAAVLLNHRIKGIALFRVCFFLPVITISVASTLVWRWILNGDFGILNYLLGMFGIAKVNWITGSDTAMLSLIVMLVWSSLGNHIIVLLAGLQGIPRMYYEAATLDGASAIQCFRRITLPLLSPALFFVVVTTLIRTLQVFDMPYLLIGSQKGRMYRLIGTVIYDYYYQTFISHNIGYGSAIVVTLFAIIIVITGLQLILQKRWVNYD